VPQPCSFQEPRLPCAMPRPTLLTGPDIRSPPPSQSNYATSSGSGVKSGERETSTLQGEVLSGTEMACTANDHWWTRILQLEHKAWITPLIFYRRSIQWKLAGMCSFLFAAAGVGMVMLASNILEVQVPYTLSDTSIEFTIERDLTAPVYVFYDLANMALNHKSIVKSKDDDLYSAFFPVKCTGAEEDDFDEVAARRGAWDPVFHKLMEASRHRNPAFRDAFKPCGLMSLAMFMDEYELYSCDLPGNGTISDAFRNACMADLGSQILLNETDIALSADEQIFKKRIEVARDGSVGIIDRDTDKVQPSWLTSGPMLEHYKVWMRSPASPFIRNRWATAPDGLRAGTYVLKLTANSPWRSGYSVQDKSLVLTESTIFGSKTSLLILGTNCGIAGLVELAMMIILILGPKKATQMAPRASNGLNEVLPDGSESMQSTV